MATTATAITTVASQPSTQRRRVTTKAPITAGFTASSIITTMIGTAMTPLTMAAHSSILIESMPEKSMPTPSSVATVR